MSEKNTMAVNEKELVYISVDKLLAHPDNPRKDIGDVTELAESIKAKGIMQNLTVVPAEGGKYTIIIGHRRCAAAMIAGVDKLPCVIVEMSPQEQVATMLLENIQRSDLTVYEQAKGFQMMMELGESVESLSQKTGFSATTVRRRLEMARLDDETLKEVADSGRQLSIGDFDRLAQIDSVKVRNKLLKSIGTHNFEYEINSALMEQGRAKAMPFLKKALTKLGAKEMSSHDRWNGKYDHVVNVKLLEFGAESEIKVPKKHMTKELRYYIIETQNTCEIWVRAEKAPKVKRPQAEIDREKYIEETRAELERITELAYILRYNFATSIKFTKSNCMKLLDGALLALMVEQGPHYVDRQNPEYYCTNLNIEKESFDTYGNRLRAIHEGYQRCMNAYEGNPQAVIIYASFGDHKNNGFVGGYVKRFPIHQKNENLEFLYKWLTAMGYEMSDDERMLLDGTHPLFIDKDAPAEVG